MKRSLTTARFTAKVRRFESPDEHPFTPETQLAKPILPPLNYPRLLYPNNVNVTGEIKNFYINAIIPAITRRATQGLGKETDDGNYGSCATRDITALEAISRRIHYGQLFSSLCSGHRAYCVLLKACSYQKASSAQRHRTLYHTYRTRMKMH